jgi:hypothetical protein
MRWVHVLLLTLVAVLLPGKGIAKVYRCQGANGGTVLTDQPKGKPGCVAIDTATPPLPGGFTPPVEPTEPAQMELPANATPPSMSAAPMVPRQPAPGDPALSPPGCKGHPRKGRTRSATVLTTRQPAESLRRNELLTGIRRDPRQRTNTSSPSSRASPQARLTLPMPLHIMPQRTV